jgi:hypothetical protein
MRLGETRKNPFWQFLFSAVGRCCRAAENNGGDDESRTSDVCRDSLEFDCWRAQNSNPASGSNKARALGKPIRHLQN